MSVTAERLMVEVQADVRQALSKLDQVEKKAGSSSSRMSKMAKGMAAGFGGAAIAGGIAKTIGMAKSFDLTMRQVGTQTGLTGDKLKSMTDLAMQMGADTAFSAADASQAMLELAKGGMTAAEQKAGGLKTTMTLAAAGGLEMANSAEYVTQALNTFGIKAANADQVAVALAGGANASTASVESLGQALSQVGPGATNAGMSLQETVSALAAFDNAGIKGSDAGTSLKTMLTGLVPATAKAKDYMDRYGLSFTKPNGEFKTMAQVAGELKSGLGGLSQVQQTQAMKAIFGSDATRAATVLMKEGAKGIRDYTKATKDRSTVEAMANTAMGGAEGAWNQLTGSVETLAIKIGSALLPAFTKGANGAAVIVNAISGSGDKVKAAFDWVKGFAEGFLAPFKPALAPLKGALTGAADGATSLKDALSPVGDFIRDNSKAFGTAAAVITTIFLPAMARAAAAATVAKVQVVAAFLAKTAAAVAHAAAAGPQMVKMGVFYAQYAAVTVAQGARVVASWVATTAASVAAMARQAAGMARLAAAYVANGLKMAAAMAANAARVVASWVLMGVQSMLQAARMAAAWVIAMGPVGWAIAAAVALAVAIVKNWDKIKAVTAKVFSWMGGFLKSVWSGIKAAVSSGVNAVKSVISTVFSAIRAVVTMQVTAWKAVIATAWGAIKAVVGAAVNFVKNAIRGWAFIASFVGGIFNRAKDAAQRALSTLMGFLSDLPGKIKGIFSAAGSWLISAGSDIINGLLDGITAGFGKVKAKLGELTGMLPDWKGPPVKDKKLLVDAGHDVIEGFVNGLTESFDSVKKTLRDLTKWIGKAMDGKEEKAWMKRIQSTNDRMKHLYDKRARIAQKAAAAQAVLEAKQQQKTDFVGNMSGGISSQANVLNAGNNAATIKDSLAAQVTKVRDFIAKLQNMRGLGYTEGVIAQVAAAGVEQGHATATALAAATAGEVAGINDSFTTINSLATSASAELGGQLYNGGISAAQSIVDGFTSKEEELKTRIRTIATNLKAAFAEVMAAEEAELKKLEAKERAKAKAKEKAEEAKDGKTGTSTTPRTAAAVGGGQGAGGGNSFHFTTHNPVAEPQSRTTNRALDRAANLGLV